MKTQKINSIKTLTTSILVAILLTIAACVDKQRNLDKEEVHSSVSESKPESKSKPPSMDIHTAALMGNLETIQQHIKAGTNLNVREQYGAATPLITAATFGKTEVAKSLIEAGADLNSKNKEGSTALHVAAFFCRTEIVKALLEKGADKSLKNNYGSTALKTVSGTFKDVKPIYEQIAKQLGHLGLKLDYEHIEMTRPKIAEVLK
ncbi:ankyrin repeat domain-containing protein [Bacteroidota bacterium]